MIQSFAFILLLALATLSLISSESTYDSDKLFIENGDKLEYTISHPSVKNTDQSQNKNDLKKTPEGKKFQNEKMKKKAKISLKKLKKRQRRIDPVLNSNSVLWKIDYNPETVLKISSGLSLQARQILWLKNSGALNLKSLLTDYYEKVLWQISHEIEKLSKKEFFLFKDAEHNIFRDLEMKFPDPAQSKEKLAQLPITNSVASATSPSEALARCRLLFGRGQAACRVLLALTRISPYKGYTQGLHNVVALGLEQQLPEDDLFYFMYGLFKTIMPDDLISPNMEALIKQTTLIVDHLSLHCVNAVKVLLPESSSDITNTDDKKMVGLSFVRYVINMLYDIVDLETSFRIVDVLLYFGDFNVILEATLQTMRTIGICGSDLKINSEKKRQLILNPNLVVHNREEFILELVKGYCDNFVFKNISPKDRDVSQPYDATPSMHMRKNACKTESLFFTARGNWNNPLNRRR